MLFHDDVTCQRHLLLNGPLASRGIYQLAHTAVGFAGMADVPPTPTAGVLPSPRVTLSKAYHLLLSTGFLFSLLGKTLLALPDLLIKRLCL